MSEESAVVEAVPDTTQSVTVDPALLNKPVRPEEITSGSADDAALKHKLGLANSHAKTAEKRAKEAEQHGDTDPIEVGKAQAKEGPVETQAIALAEASGNNFHSNAGWAA